MNPTLKSAKAEQEQSLKRNKEARADIRNIAKDEATANQVKQKKKKRKTI